MRLNHKQIIQTKDAPAPIGPYSQAVKCGNLLFLSGQIAINPASGDLITDDLKNETHRIMQNLDAVLKASGMSFAHVVKTSIFLKDMQFFQEVNEIYSSYFKSDFPARETVAVAGLPKGVNVEISMIASLD